MKNEQVPPEVLEYSETIYDARGEPIGKMSTRCVRLSEYNWLRSENEQLRTALSFYADPQTYGRHGGSCQRVLADSGDRAREALKPTPLTVEARHD